MIYVEFIERDRSTPIEIFRHLGNQQSAWAEGAEDRMILQLGRTLRLGPRPTYLCLWEIPGIGRLDDWEKYFRSPAASLNRRSRAMHGAIRIERAGLYTVLWRGDSLEAPLYAIEYCEPTVETAAELIRQQQDRIGRHPDLTPMLLLKRFGKLGPDPALLSIWGAASYVALEPLFHDCSSSAWNLLDVGVYRTFGEEVL